jgi:hypothetical protein
MRRLVTAAAAVLAAGALWGASTLYAGALSGGAKLLADTSPAITNSVSVTPTSALLYTFTGFTVSGTAEEDGEPLGGLVNVTFNGAGVGSAEVDGDDGSFSTEIPIPQPEEAGAIPATPVCGANTVTVETDEDDEAEDFEVGSATINLLCASISVSPGLVGNQQLPATFAVTPQNFPEPGGFTLTVDGTPQAFTTAPGGGLDFTGSPSCGAHQVTLSQTFDEQVISATAQITVLCPQITLTPSSIPLASQPATVTVTGSQFHANQPVSVSLDGTVVGSTVTDETGSFSLPITAAGLDCAAHQVTAAEQATAGGPAFLFSATATLQVTGCTLALAVDPTVLEPGQLTKVTGTGFAPGTPVTLAWQQPGGAPLLGTATVTAGGDGSISAFLLVMPGDLTGPRQVVATQSGLKLTADALVEAAPMQPSPGGQLVYRP